MGEKHVKMRTRFGQTKFSLSTIEQSEKEAIFGSVEKVSSNFPLN